MKPVTDPTLLEQLDAPDSPPTTSPSAGRIRVPEGYNGGHLLYNDTGVGSGMLNLGRSAVNLMLPKSMEPSWATDEAVKNARAKTKEEFGFVGPFIGEQMAMAPVSLVGKGAQALGALSKFPKLMSFLGAITEGGVTGALASNPGERTTGAVTGGALSGGMRALGMAGGKAAEGIVQKSDEAKELIRQADLHGVDLELPLGEAAKPGLVKSLYREVLPNMPFAGGALRKQGDDAAKAVRQLALQESLPMGGTMPTNAGDDVLSAVKNIGGQFDDAYNNTVKSYVFNLPNEQDLAAKITARITAKMPKADSTTIQNAVDDILKEVNRFSDGKSVIEGTNLLNAKNYVGSRIGDLYSKNATVDAEALKHGRDVIEDLIVDQLTPVGTKGAAAKQALADLTRYQGLSAPFANFKAVEKAAESSKLNKGHFTFGKLASVSPEKGPLLKIAQNAAEVLDEGVGNATLPGRFASYGVLGTIGLGSPVTAATVMGGGRALASKGVQRALMGDTALQQAMIKQLRSNPELYRAIEAATRRGVAGAAGSP